jgi:hypothetical protein
VGKRAGPSFAANHHMRSRKFQFVPAQFKNIALAPASFSEHGSAMQHGRAMHNIRDKLDLFRVEAEDCELIAKLATDPKKRAMFAHLANRFRDMAAQLEAGLKEPNNA